MKFQLAIFLMLVPSIASAIDTTHTLTKAQFRLMTIQRNGITLNEFTIAEKKALLSEKMTNIEVAFSARNETDSHRHFAFMLAGLDKSGRILWSMALEPLMSVLSKHKIENVQKSVYCPPRALIRTRKIWWRIIGDF